VLIYNKKAELVIRNKLFEMFIRHIEIQIDQDADIDYKMMYREFGSLYDDIIKSTGIYEKYIKIDFIESEPETNNY
jgi:hypothetical protein